MFHHESTPTKHTSANVHARRVQELLKARNQSPDTAYIPTMAKSVEMLPERSEERCDACAFPLEGLPMKGRCPECGTRYAFTFLFRRTALGSERCGAAGEPGCGYSLKGLPLRGACPECGRTYWFDRPRRERPAPGFRDLLSHAAVRIGIPSTAMMIGLFIVMIAAAMGVILWSLWERIDAIFFKSNFA